MKIRRLILSVLSLLTPLSHADTPALTVHEWGTFTLVTGSDGIPLPWWFAGLAPQSELPAFVKGNANLKSAPSLMRMETPVLYFYPDKPMSVEVRAEMHDGRITEWFPPPAKSEVAGPMGLNHTVTWKGQLLFPTDAVASAMPPAVSGDRGAHYAHAREVPDAWLFQSQDAETKTLQTEKFIFYRGVTNSLPPLQVRPQNDGSIQLTSLGANSTLGAAFAVQTTDGKRLLWSRVPAPPQEGSAADLAAALTDALTAAGLTNAEAKAMIATWNGHWFSEPGTRVLALLPQSWVDTILPLTITPPPQKLVRLFVARFEVLTPEREDAFLALLSEKATAASPAKSAARLEALHLGRFTTAALQRAQNLMTQRLYLRYDELQKASDAANGTNNP